MARYGKTHRVSRRKNSDPPAPGERPEDKPAEDGRKPVSLPTVDWMKRPLPGDEKK